MSAVRLSKADTAREMLQGLGNHARPTIAEPGDNWVGLAAAANFCQVKPRVVADAARRGAVKVRWFQRSEVAIPVPVLGRAGVERLADELRRERELAAQTRQQRQERREQERALAEQRKELRETADLAPVRSRLWFQVYQSRIDRGSEECRECGATESLWICRVDHRQPWTLQNVTILCAEHATDFPPQDGLFHWRLGMETLLDEERAAPPKRRWALAAIKSARRSSVSRGTVTG